MRIVIDMQGAQTESPSHSSTGYALTLAQAMVRSKGDHEIILALSGLFPDTIEPIRAALNNLLPQENIRVWHSLPYRYEAQPVSDWRRNSAELIREAFMASLKPDALLIPCFFDDRDESGVISIGAFAPNIPTLAILGTPDVLADEAPKSEQPIPNLQKYGFLERADMILVAAPLEVDSVCQHINIPRDRVLPISAIEAIDDATSVRDALSAMAGSIWNTLSHFSPSNPVDKTPSIRVRRPKLAYVSPLPPERSGIADYSAELLPALAEHYDVDVIVNQPSVSDPWINTNCGIRQANWFVQNHAQYERVIYHFGNSPFHLHMFDMLIVIPGVVVLHDFFLGEAQLFRETHDISPNAWTKALYSAHGYGAVAERFRENSAHDVVSRYPATLDVLQDALGVIVHSEHARRLADKFYGNGFSAHWEVIPLLRVPYVNDVRMQARQTLGLKADEFLVCSFGLLGPTKLNHRLLEAWQHSRLAQDERCILVFVGENHQEEYGAQMLAAIRASGLSQRIRITGWADTDAFRNYLAAADAAVQLRTHSRGETSAAVLDCMNHAIPTIVNANGAMADLPPSAVWMLPDEFENAQLVEALETLWQGRERRASLGSRAREIILTQHAPATCALQYANAIEHFYARAQVGTQALTNAIGALEGHNPSDAECANLALAISQSIPPVQPARQLLIDVSATCRDDLKTGIQRVVRALVWELIQAPPPGYRIEPVYMTDAGGYWHYRYARSWTSRALDFPGEWASDEVTEFATGDLMLVADFTAGYVVAGQLAGIFQKLRNAGVALHFVVFDLLPIQMPSAFPSHASSAHASWLNAVCLVADSAICISQAVAEDFRSQVRSSGAQRLLPLRIEWFHLGANLKNSIPSRGMPENSEQVLSTLRASPSFLMVGTIEPRKGHAQTIAAFDELWSRGFDINLVIVGKQGWAVETLSERLRTHPELGQRIFWLEGVSDEYLEKLYAASACLIAASEGEGFGLPLIEAAQHKLPIIARDLPVFREVAGEHAYYFRGLTADDLAEAIQNWLSLFATGSHPRSDAMPWLTWEESTQQLLQAMHLPDFKHRHVGYEAGNSSSLAWRSTSRPLPRQSSQ